KYWETSDGQKLSYLYHKAKSDGTNPELVKAVEDLIAPQAAAPVSSKVENETNPTPTVTEPISKTTTEPAAKAKAGVTEEVQPSPVSVGQGDAEGAAAVLTPKAGDQVVIPSKQTKGVITYVRREDGWYFKDSRGKFQKETAANQAKLDDQWRAAQGSQQEKGFQGEEKPESKTYVDKARNVLQALFPDAKFEVYESSREYRAATGDTEGRGSYNPKTKTVALNLQKMREDAVTKTPIHEVIHPIVKAAAATDADGINKMWQSLLDLGDVEGMNLVWQHVANYEPSQQAEEGITEFITRVVDGSIRLDQVPKSLADKVIDLINKIFKAIGIDVELGSAADLRRLSEAVKKAFETGDVSAVAKLIGAEQKPSMDFALMKENGKFNLQKIADYAKQIIEGTRVFERFSQGEQRGIAAGGQIHAEASIILAAENATNTTSNADPQWQEDTIEKYAKQKGIWIDDVTKTLKSKYGEIIGAGQEAIVFDDGKDVVKSQNTLMYGTLQEKLDGITLMNTLFPESAVEVIGFGRNDDGDFQVVVRQPFIEGEKLTKSEINDYLSKIGFTNEIDDGIYTDASGQTVIEDVHTGNAIRTPEGNIVVIDPIVRLNTSELGYGGKRQIGGGLDASILRDKGEGAIEKWLKQQVLQEVPDVTVDEVMAQIEEDAPKLIDTPQKRADVEARVRAVIEPSKSIIQEADDINAKRTINARNEAKKAFKEKYGEEANKVMDINNNFDNYIAQLKEKGIIEKIVC
ncbi:MAG TPA: hypothetical protein VFM18_06625, partial [Methanosarcina sp.]|nr:hypothetical protein [Methanosarcina sp.]